MSAAHCLVCLFLLTALLRCVARRYVATVHGNLTESNIKIEAKLKQFDKRSVPIKQRNLVIYNIGAANVYESGKATATNNLVLFTSAMQLHSEGAPQEAFYLFNVIWGKENPLRDLIPSELPNVGIIDWHHANDDPELHMLTVKLLGNTIFHSFGAVFFLNSEVRGPLVSREDGQWLQDFRALLDRNNVGMVGPMHSCELAPHVPNFMYALRPKILDLLLQKNEYYMGNSDFVRNSGFNISSMLYSRKYRAPYFDGRCALAVESKALRLANPVSWCHILPKEVIFMQWGGETLRLPGYLCEHTKALMRDLLATFRLNYPNMPLIVPETLTGGRLYEMTRQYAEEMYLDYVSSPAPSGLDTTLLTKPDAQETGPPPAAATEEVCFAVRTAFMHDSSEEVQSRTIFDDITIEPFIRSLLRQTDLRWVGYFFVTDRNPFEDRLQEILAKYQDPRLVYMPIPPPYRVKYTAVDAGYTATDYIISLMLKRRACRWISATNADNIYGSQVVHNVLHAAPDPITKKVADMQLNPIDSRNFMWIDNIERRELARGEGAAGSWKDHCAGLEAAVLFNPYTYTVQPSPVMGKVDLAAVFFSREKYAAENIRFGNFTDPRRYRCHGCQDGYLTEYLVRSRHWTYRRLAIDGIGSIIFHGPSPTLCVASGGVWYDYPSQNKVGCIDRDTVRVLNNHYPEHYDWPHWNFKGNKFCLRLSRAGFYEELGLPIPTPVAPRSAPAQAHTVPAQDSSGVAQTIAQERSPPAQNSSGPTQDRPNAGLEKPANPAHERSGPLQELLRPVQTSSGPNWDRPDAAQEGLGPVQQRAGGATERRDRAQERPVRTQERFGPAVKANVVFTTAKVTSTVRRPGVGRTRKYPNDM